MTKIVKHSILIFVFLCLASSYIIQDEIVVEYTGSQENNIVSNYEPAPEVHDVRLLQTAINTGSGQTLTVGSVTKYTNLILNHEIPANFLIGEIFQIRGRLNFTAASPASYAILGFYNSVTKVVSWFKATIPAGQTAFVLNVDTKSVPAGSYYLGFIGTNSSTASVSFASTPLYKFAATSTQTLTTAAPVAPTGGNLSFADNKLTLKWNEDSKTPIEKITFTQTGVTPVEYILSNFQSSFEVPFKDFVNFKFGVDVTVTIASAYSSIYSAFGRMSNFSPAWSFTFKAGNHAFSESSTGVSLTSTIPWTVAIGYNLVLTGTTTGNVKNIIVTEEPGFAIGNYKLTNTTSAIIPAGTAFSTTIPLTKEGVYIIEINNDGGGAIINRPVYVGPALPLIPDFVDIPSTLTPAQIIAAQPTDIATLRKNLLGYINAKRNQWGRGNLTETAELDGLAQQHSDDMVVRNYFSHNTIDNPPLTPQDRAKLRNITYGVGQNIAYSIDLLDAHNRLCRSPGHLANIVLPTYTTVGLGVTKNSQGYLYVTQNFATPPTNSTTNTTNSTTTNTTNTTTTTTLNATQLESIRSQFLAYMLKQYTWIVQDPVISSGIKTWYTNSAGATIFDYFRNTLKYSATTYTSPSLTGPVLTDYSSLLASNPGLLKASDTTFIKFGVNLKQVNSTTIQVNALYAK